MIIKTVALLFLLWIGATLGIFFFFSKPPSRALFIQPVHRFETEDKVVALTFDDGPSAKATEMTLNILKNHNVKATYFVVGQNAIKYPLIIKRMAKEGHDIGHHTYSHSRMLFKTPSFIREDIDKMDSLFVRLTGRSSVIYRPPYGTKMISLPLVLKQKRKTLITWDTEPKAQYDRENFNGEIIARQILNGVKPGSIILLHDGWSGIERELGKALEKIISSLKEENYEFITITEGIKKYRGSR